MGFGTHGNSGLKVFIFSFFRNFHFFFFSSFWFFLSFLFCLSSRSEFVGGKAVEFAWGKRPKSGDSGGSNPVFGTSSFLNLFFCFCFLFSLF